MTRKLAVNSIVTASLAVLALALPAAASAAPSTGAVVFSKSSGTGKDAKGGLFAVREGRLNQLTEDPADSEPSFSADGHMIAFVREGDVWAMRADGSGQKQLTTGAELDSRPLVAPNGRYVVFERRTAPGQPRSLYTVGVGGGGAVHALAPSPSDESEASFSPDGCTIAFVRAVETPAGGAEDDVFTVRPAGIKLRRLTRTPTIDEFAPRDLDETIVYGRGKAGTGPSAYADIYTMDERGQHVRKLIAGAGSAYVEDATADGRTVLFRRDQGLWVKAIGPAKARKLTELPDGSKTNCVFSSDGRRVAAFVTHEGEQTLVSINVANGRQSYLAEGFADKAEEGTEIGPVMAWQPVPHAH
jgi:dipeptidyl aminopeptidase/acylaminoacyl peptidase